MTNRGIVVDLLYEQQKVILLCMAAMEVNEPLTEIVLAAAEAFSNDSSADEISLSFGLGPVVAGITQANLSFAAADKACEMGGILWGSGYGGEPLRGDYPRI
ncbi:hypothetical protein ACFTAO_34130 [Paenibacillus rhizoplanae]